MKVLLAIAAVAIALGIWQSVKNGLIKLGATQERSRIQGENMKAGAAARKKASNKASTATQRARKLEGMKDERSIVEGVDGLFK